jgi:hypothetical protein
MLARLLLLCLLFGSSWLAAESGRQVAASGVLHRRGGRAVVAVSVDVAVAFHSRTVVNLDWLTEIPPIDGM